MFLSPAQIQVSAEELQQLHPFFGIGYLAFKQAKIPVGKSLDVVASQLVEQVLRTYYRVTESFDGFYSPFVTSNPSNRWLAPRYGSTSHQRILADTFADVFLHQKGTSQWGWCEDYVDRLETHLRGHSVPAFDLAVWLFRSEAWPDNVSRSQVRDRLFKEFVVTRQERDRLFDTSLPKEPDDWLSPTRISESQLLDIIGHPPGSRPYEGGLLRSLEIHQIGPAASFRYEPGDRLNIVTGDNSLGKTFLLDIIWWSLTGNWCKYQALPRMDVPKQKPKISFEVSVGPRKIQPVIAEYAWRNQKWHTTSKRESVAGLVVYSRFDGAYAVWDPARVELENDSGAIKEVIFSPSDVWDGVRSTGPRGTEQWLCNGLILDWVRWQTSGEDYQERFDALVACLAALSPAEHEPLTPGKPLRRFPLGARETPTLALPYGEVPIQLASAGIQRVVALAYILVWAWHEHMALVAAMRTQPQRRIVLLIDEVEAHLHPRWQRVMVPALMDVVGKLSEEASAQIHLATHSPMILASAEPVFDEAHDKLFHLRLQGTDVTLDELPFVKRGRSDFWLLSDVFGLDHPRSVPASRAIEDAKNLQMVELPDVSSVAEVHSRLVEHLAPDDEFWPRWIYFAKQHGVIVS